ncbi:MAG: DUF4286 family protein [Bacteroidetes bacterium]|nr:DUF4286 family protein [Bacteroidota bacterium]
MDRNLAKEWLDWMLKEHLPEVMATGCFLDARVMRMITHADDDDGVNIAIQYTTPDMDTYERYQAEFGPGLRQKTLQRWGDQVTAFRSLLELIQ